MLKIIDNNIYRVFRIFLKFSCEILFKVKYTMTIFIKFFSEILKHNNTSVRSTEDAGTIFALAEGEK